MKVMAQSEYNWAKEVTERAEEELALARLIRRGADWDLVQAKKTIEDLLGKLATAIGNWNALWQYFRSVVDLLRTPKDDGLSWGQFVLMIPICLWSFVKKGAQVTIRNILAHVRVLAPAVPLEKLVEDAES
jgi:hypothetical protein